MRCSISVMTLTLSATLLLPAESPAQEKGKARISGLILAASDRQPIAGARIRIFILDRPIEILSNAEGRFVLKDLPAGDYKVQIEADGLTSQEAPVTLGPRDRFDMEFLVGVPPAVVLPELEVVEAVPGWPKGTPVSSGRPEFERRRQEGNGRYFGPEEIARRNAPTLQDLLRMVPGVVVDCRNNTHVCSMRFNRSPRGCGPAYWVDGIPATDPSVLYLTRPTDLAGVEVYSGSSQVPPEMEGRNSRCGVVAIWTKVGEKPSERERARRDPQNNRNPPT